MKKLFIITLTSLMIICMLSGCKNTSQTGTSDTNGNGGNDMLSLIKDDGTSDYQIVYSKNSTCKSAAIELKSRLNGLTGGNFTVKVDTEATASDYEILIGSTNRAESTDMLVNVVDGHWGMIVSGNKILINSAEDEGITAAVDYFIENYLTDSNKKVNVPKNLSVYEKIPQDSAPDNNNTQTESQYGWKFKSYKASNGFTLPYQIYLPKNMDTSKEYPVLIYMHGLGSVGTDGSHIYSNVANILRVVEKSKYKDDVIMIAPQHAKGLKWVEGPYATGVNKFDNYPMTQCLQAAKELFDKSINELPIDKSRIYGYGGSMGACSLFYLVSKYPDFFSAVVPVAGACDPDKASLLLNVPMWVIHGDADKTVSIEGAKKLVENIKALGGTKVKMTVLEGIGHHGIYCFKNAAEIPGLLDWIFSQKKA